MSVRTKLILLLAFTATVVLATIALAISHSLRREVRREVVRDFAKTQYHFERLGSLLYDRLVESCLLIGQNSAFKANVALGDRASVQQAVEEFASYTKTDLLVVTDIRGTVLAWLGQTDTMPANLAEQAGMAAALAGEEPDWRRQHIVLWQLDRRLYQVATVPIFAGNNLLGTITMGARFTDFEAEFLKGRSDFAISFFLDGRLVGSSITDEELPDRHDRLQQFHQTHASEIKSALATGEVFTAHCIGKEVFAFANPLGVGANGYYLATVEQAKEMALIPVLSRRIIYIGLAGFVASILLALLLGNRFTRPVRELAMLMEQVEQGRLDTTLAVRSHDEIGQLALAFNNMIRGLKERLSLMKYVGGHTLDMIRSDQNDWRAGRGRRMEVAVLFTDIRGFTAYSEVHEPEKVIAMLNSWLGFQADLVTEYGGFIDKYAGDELMALFTGEKALRQAYRCAQAIQQRAELLARHQGESIAIGIGLNYGPVVMGNVGVESRMDYTVIGASVNLGARLCAAARGGEILLTTELAAQLQLDLSQAAQELVLFKGITQAMRIVRIGSRKVESGSRKTENRLLAEGQR